MSSGTPQGLFSASEEEYLAQIVRGGRSGGAGARYEDWYAVYRLLCAALALERGGPDASIELQAHAFVNDVVVRDDVTDYCQAKTSPKATWDADLRRQFLLQGRWCRALRERFRLVLVTPHARLRARRRKPRGVSAGVDVFPNVPPWAPTSPAALVLKDLSGDPDAGPSQTEALAKAYLSALLDVAPGQPCMASAATAAVRGFQPVLVRSSAPPPASWLAAERILTAIPGLRVSLERGTCTYTYAHGHERGIVGCCGTAAFARIVDRIVERKPTTFAEFEKEL